MNPFHEEYMKHIEENGFSVKAFFISMGISFLIISGMVWVVSLI